MSNSSSYQGISVKAEPCGKCSSACVSVGVPAHVDGYVFECAVNGKCYRGPATTIQHFNVSVVAAIAACRATGRADSCGKAVSSSTGSAHRGVVVSACGASVSVAITLAKELAAGLTKTVSYNDYRRVCETLGFRSNSGDHKKGQAEFNKALKRSSVFLSGKINFGRGGASAKMNKAAKNVHDKVKNLNVAGAGSASQPFTGECGANFKCFRVENLAQSAAFNEVKNNGVGVFLAEGKGCIPTPVVSMLQSRMSGRAIDSAIAKLDKMRSAGYLKGRLTYEAARGSLLMPEDLAAAAPSQADLRRAITSAVSS